MSAEQAKAFIANERKAGTSDIKIFLKMQDHPVFSKGIKKANDAGLNNRQFAQQIGLKISAPQSNDTDQQVKSEIKKQAKEAGPTKAWESGLLGFSDLGAGVIQGFTYAADGINKGINKVAGTNLDTNTYERFTKERKDIDDFHKMRREANGQGFDGWRLGGQVASMPLPIGRTYQGAKVLSGAGAKIAGENALVGAGLSGVSFAENANERLTNTALGGVGGALGGAVGEKLGQRIAKATQGVKNQSARFSTERTNEILRSIDDKLDNALQSQGMRLSELSDEVANGLRNEAKRALQSGKALNPEAIARKASLEKVGIKGTRAQITGDAKQWQNEAELAKVKGGEPLRDKFISDNERLSELLDDQISKTGGRSIDQFGAGKEAAETLLGQYSQNKQFVNQAYNFAKNAQGNDVLISGQGFANDVFTALDDQALGSFLPADIKKIVTQISENPSYFTLRKGEELIKVLNNHYKSSLNPNGEKTATTHALSVVRQALQSRQDEALQGLVSQGGNDAAQAYQFAREAYKANAGLKAQMPLLQDVLKQQSKGSVNFDDLYKKHVLNGKIEELSKTFEVLRNTNPQAIADIQQEVMKDITSKAVNASGQFSPAGMKRALDALGDRKLGAIFSPDQVKKLKDIRQAGHYAVTQPNHSYVNNSNSASSLLNYLGNIISSVDHAGKRIPWVTNAVTGPIKQAATHNQAAQALKGGAIDGAKSANQANLTLLERLTQAGVLTGANDMK